MKKIMLSSVAVLVFSAGAAVAAVPALDLQDVLSVQADGMVLQVKDGENSGSGGGGNSGHGGGDRDDNDNDDNDNDSNDDNDNDDNSDDDNGGASNGSDDDNNGLSGSGRKKPRVPGGSGCDDPGDVAEHPECSP